MAKGRMHTKAIALQKALSGVVTDHHATILQTMLDNIDRLGVQSVDFDARSPTPSLRSPTRSTNSTPSQRSASPPPKD